MIGSIGESGFTFQLKKRWNQPHQGGMIDISHDVRFRITYRIRVTLKVKQQHNSTPNATCESSLFICMLLAGPAIWACPASFKKVGSSTSTSKQQVCAVRCQAKGEKLQAEIPRREAMAAIGLTTALSLLPGGVSNAAGLPPGPPPPKLCDVDCEKDLDNVRHSIHSHSHCTSELTMSVT